METTIESAASYLIGSVINAFCNESTVRLSCINEEIDIVSCSSKKVEVSASILYSSETEITGSCPNIKKGRTTNKYVTIVLYKMFSDFQVYFWLDKNKNMGYTITVINVK
jgi:hypothetical protein